MLQSIPESERLELVKSVVRRIQKKFSTCFLVEQIQIRLSVPLFSLLFLLIAVDLSEINDRQRTRQKDFYLDKGCDLLVPFSIKQRVFQLPGRKED